MGKVLFIATFITDNPNAIVHSKRLEEDHRIFLLNTNCELIFPDDRKPIFPKYWDIGDVEKQWQFIADNVQVKLKQGSYGKGNTKRQNSMTYSMKNV